MITKVNGNNYEELFRAAEVQLGKPTGSIDTIHAYLDAISAINVRKDSNNYNLLRLPVEADEPLFVIDANTREIKIPDVFKQNGLTIQGDMLAEIVYFKMARFFDMMDLYRFRNDNFDGTTHMGAHAYIEWYNPSAKAEEYQKGVDLAYAMTCDDDYIYFGWPLADKVSGEAGNIQFTVRFLEIEGEEIIYNYSTKIASCEIKTTLNFDIKDGGMRIDSYEDLLYNRAIYSSVINSIESPAAILLKGIETGIYDMTKTIEEYNTGDIDENEDPIMGEREVWNLDIPVVATVSSAIGTNPNTGEPLTQTLTFQWYRNDLQLPASEIPARVTTDNAPAEYEDEKAKQSVFHANKVGRYTVYIGNQIEGKNNVRYIYTGTVTIPGPEAVIMDRSGISDKGYVGKVVLTAGVANTVSQLNPVYTWYKYVDGEAVEIPGVTGATYTPTDEGVYFAHVKNLRNGEETGDSDASFSQESDVRMAPQRLTSLTLDYNAQGKYFVCTATHAYAGHKIHYTWYRLDPKTLEQSIIKDELTGTQSEFEPTQPGNYYVYAREVVFDDDPILRTEASASDRSTSNEIQLDENLQQIVGE